MAIITEKQVTRFAIRARKIKLLGDAQKELNEEIKGALRKGATIPTDGPYVIDLSQVGGKDFSWEEEYGKLLVKNYKKDGYKQNEAEALAAKAMEDLKKAAPDKKAEVIGGETFIGGVKLTPKVNAKFGKKEEAAA